jgi:hypothetical protein
MVTGNALVAGRNLLAVIRRMKNLFHATTVPPNGVLPRSSPIIRLITGMAGILMALLFQGTGEVRGQTPQGSYQVKLAWNASTSADVVGYRIHYGTASGTYTSTIVIGNVTSTTVTGLADGETYHFVVSAFNADGSESGLSNEVGFKPGLHTAGIRIAANGGSVLIVRGLIGRQYEIEASEDLNTWMLIDTVTMPEGGSLEFSDPDAPLHPKRFYRTRAIP